MTICSSIVAKATDIDLIKFWGMTFFRNEVKNNLSNFDTDLHQFGLAIIHDCQRLKANTMYEVDPNLHYRDPMTLYEKYLFKPEEILDQCSFRSKNLGCKTVFNKVLFRMGFCYSYNMLDLSEVFNLNAVSRNFSRHRIEVPKSTWSLSGGYKSSDTNFPVRALRRNSFQIFLRVNPADYNNTCKTLQDRTNDIYFHLPNEMPTEFKERVKLSIEVGKFQRIFIEAKMFTADQGLRKYDPKSRGCFFEGELKTENLL
jgi:hypothetical protein